MAEGRGALVALLLSLAAAGPDAASADAGQVGEPAPGFVAIDLATGDTLDVAALQGRAVLLNKWTTWCLPCVQEMPYLQALHERYGPRGFTVVGISVDRPGSEGMVERLARSRGVTYPIWLDPEDRFTQVFQSIGVPESILLDKHGVVVRRWSGAIAEGDTTVDAAIGRALEASGNYAEGARAAAGTDPASLGILVALCALAAGLLSFLAVRKRLRGSTASAGV